MALSDCPKCWETPCLCGHEYADWSADRLRAQIAMLCGILTKATAGREDSGLRRGVMCLTDFEYEAGEAAGGTKVFPSIEDLRKTYACAEACGIAEVEIRLVQIAQHPTDPR